MIRVSLAALLASTAGATAQLADGSFEISGPAYPGGPWSQYSSNFGTPLCNGDCFSPGAATAAHSGLWWAWFGGEDTAIEQASLTQVVAIPANTAYLQFFLTADSTRSDGTDYLRVSIDAAPIYNLTDLGVAPYSAIYVPVNIDISNYAGGTHLVRFECVTHGGGFLTNFFVDDVALLAAANPCFANCDNSIAPPILNANDFQCFLNKYAAQDPTANCDGSTTPPILNANDFQCFLNAYAAGCS